MTEKKYSLERLIELVLYHSSRDVFSGVGRLHISDFCYSHNVTPETWSDILLKFYEMGVGYQIRFDILFISEIEKHV
jgi:hypothetical protein